jgi:hypothetical protein
VENCKNRFFDDSRLSTQDEGIWGRAKINNYNNGKRGLKWALKSS